MTLLLRHKPELAGLQPDPAGWCSVTAVAAAVSRRCGTFTPESLRREVRANDKQRFELSLDGRRVRAVQGHSLAVDLGLTPVAPPTVLYHGTKARHLAAILAAGLLAMGRQHVHLSETLPTARQVARRRKGASAVLRVEPADGDVYYRSSNGVWLTAAVPPERLTVLETESDRDDAERCG